MHVVFAAKVMFTASVLGLSSTAIGFLIIFHFLDEATTKVGSRIVRPMKHIRYRSLFRYNNRYFFGRIRVGNYLAYASIGLFIGGAFLSGMILIFS
jgi:hypothetical protein